MKNPLTLDKDDERKIMKSLLNMLYKNSKSNDFCADQNKVRYLNIKKKDLNSNYIANKDIANAQRTHEFSMNVDVRYPKPHFRQFLCLTETTVVYVFNNCSESTKEDLY